MAERTGDLEGPEDPCSPKERAKMDAFRVVINPRRAVGAIIVRPRNFCECGATGNYHLWVFVTDRGSCRLILDTDMVQDFGFLKARTNGYRDLVLWAHDSADRSPARLLQFDGKQYHEVCAWEEDYEFRELPDGRWVSTGDPKIVSNSCGP